MSIALVIIEFECPANCNPPKFNRDRVEFVQWAWQSVHMAANEGIYNALCSAVSQNPVQLRVGEATLKQWETQRGYYAALAVSGT